MKLTFYKIYDTLIEKEKMMKERDPAQNLEPVQGRRIQQKGDKITCNINCRSL